MAAYKVRIFCRYSKGMESPIQTAKNARSGGYRIHSFVHSMEFTGGLAR
jgi:hypothetical protein